MSGNMTMDQNERPAKFVFIEQKEIAETVFPKSIISRYAVLEKLWQHVKALFPGKKQQKLQLAVPSSRLI